MNQTQIEAIVLHALPFKEYDRILTLFSPQGLLKLFVKGKKKEYLKVVALTSVLTHGEYHFTLGRKELHRLSDGTILNQHLRIRDRFETLLAAERMIKALLQSQWPGKPAPKLFQLFCLLMDHLPNVNDPSALATAFLLKVLRHEGILQLCTPLKSAFRFAGERYSKEEAPPGALSITEEEEELLTELALCRTLSQIAEHPLSVEFQQKIEHLFTQSFLT